MQPIFLTDDLIITKSILLNGVRYIANSGLENDITIYLPSPQAKIHFEILQTSDKMVTVQTNNPSSYFLWGGFKKQILINGGECNYGSRIKFDSYNGNWLIRAYATNPESFSLQE